LAGTENPTELDFHIAPYWEMIALWKGGPMQSTAEYLDYDHTMPNVMRFLERLKAHDGL
jgi:hypothetical protein